MPQPTFIRCAQAGLAAACFVISLNALAADAPKALVKAAAAKKAAAVKPPAVPAYKTGAPLPAATPEQIEAAELVYVGHYECEFDQAIDIKYHEAQLGYVDVQFGKSVYLMKPVLSSTGAVRLEDMRGETLMVQIGSKSMLLNTKTGRRLVDECVSPRQREAVEAAKQAKAAETAAVTAEQQAQSAAAAASAASAAAGTAAQAASAASAAAASGLAAPAAPTAPALPAVKAPQLPSKPSLPGLPKPSVQLPTLPGR
ncbi:MAG TPA: hypothetical protein VKI18_06010 [Albitalea sp.]|nr:hypothetical protein [Albitalea sp.]